MSGYAWLLRKHLGRWDSIAIADITREDVRTLQSVTNTLAYETSAAAYYRIEWLLRNKRLDRTYSPARCQLLAALKLRILGEGSLPAGDRKSKTELEKLLDVVWDAQAAEELVNELLPALDTAVEEETPGVALNRDTVRTRSFSDRRKAQVSALPARA